MRQKSFRPSRRLIFGLATVVAAATLGGCYLSHLAGGQLGVLCDSVELEKMLARSDLTAADKAKLRFIQEVKRFAERRIGLEPSCNFSKYLDRPRGPIVHVLTAVRRRDLEPKTWWYPIVGRISYKGFFERPAALAEAAELKHAGYDTYIRPATAYSTLGWFCDPVVPSMLDLDQAELASLVIHELVHPTIYVAGDTRFNESLADFVGREGARQFFAAASGKREDLAARLERNAAAERALDAFMRALETRLRQLHANGWKDAEARRRLIFSQAKQELNALCRKHDLARSLCDPDEELNSAVVLAHVTYGTEGPFQDLFLASGRDWGRFFAAVRRLHQTD